MGFIYSHSYEAKQTKQQRNPQMNLAVSRAASWRLRGKSVPSPSLLLEAGACSTLWLGLHCPNLPHHHCHMVPLVIFNKKYFHINTFE